MKKYIRKGTFIFTAEQNEKGEIVVKHPQGREFVMTAEEFERDFVEFKE